MTYCINKLQMWQGHSGLRNPSGSLPVGHVNINISGNANICFKSIKYTRYTGTLIFFCCPKLLRSKVSQHVFWPCLNCFGHYLLQIIIDLGNIMCVLPNKSCIPWQMTEYLYHQLRFRRVLSIVKDVLLRTRRAQSPRTLYIAIAPFWFSTEHL